MKKLLNQCNPKINDGILYSDATIKKLIEIILSDEKIKYAVRDINILGVCTDRRFIGLTAKTSISTDAEDVTYENIKGLKINSGLGNDDLEVLLSRHKITLKFTGKDRAKDLYNYLQIKLSQLSKIETPSLQNQKNTNADVIEQLEKLAKLQEQGILTESEFTDNA